MKILACTLAALALFASPSFAEPIREGSGQRRAALDKLELKPYDATIWGSLSDWRNGAAPSAADLSGKVVLICTWSGYYQPAAKGLQTARKMAEQFGKDGLVVIAAHHPTAWDKATIPEAPKETVFLVAHDAKGEFRKALQVDQDPDFYVIDRAGQMRFADINTESVQEAVEKLLKEDADSAAGTQTRLDKMRAEADAELRRSRAINEKLDLTAIPELPFPEVPPEAYEHTAWPARPKVPNQQPGQEPPVRNLTLPEGGSLIPTTPPLKGRAAVVFYWNPAVVSSYDKLIGQMDLLQKKYGRDIVVVGAICSRNIGADQNTSAPDPSTLTPEQKADRDPEVQAVRARGFHRSNSLNYPLAVDLDMAAVGGPPPYWNGAVPVGYVAVVSTDGVIRWDGVVEQGAFTSALDRVLAVDPAVRARRKVEAEYVKKVKP